MHYLKQSGPHVLCFVTVDQFFLSLPSLRIVWGGGRGHLQQYILGVKPLLNFHIIIINQLVNSYNGLRKIYAHMNFTESKIKTLAL